MKYGGAKPHPPQSIRAHVKIWGAKPHPPQSIRAHVEIWGGKATPTTINFDAQITIPNCLVTQQFNLHFELTKVGKSIRLKATNLKNTNANE